MLMKASFFKCTAKGCWRTLKVEVLDNVGKVLDPVIIGALKLLLNLVKSLLINYRRSSTSRLPCAVI